MRVNNLYIYGENIVDEECYIRHAHLLKLLFRLEVLDHDQALDFMLKFHPFFV